MNNRYSHTELNSGYKVKIERTLDLNSNKFDISNLTALSIDKLQSMRDRTAKVENNIFEKLCKIIDKWEAQAVNTALIDKAMEYIETPVAEHTANEWKQGQYEDEEIISNKVYKLYFRVYERKFKIAPSLWYVSWHLSTNSPAGDDYNQRIAGLENKKYTDKTEFDNYIARKKSLYAKLFTELSPPIPKKLIQSFMVNNQLLPGYTIQPEEQPKKKAKK